jgi:hypothetical protein
VYVWASINGEKIFKYMSKDEILIFMKFSKSAFDKNLICGEKLA